MIRTMAAIVLGLALLVRCAAGVTKPTPADPLLDAAVAAVDAWQFAPLQAALDQAAATAMADPEKADLAHLSQVATLQEFARWFGRVRQPTAAEKAAASWLVRQRRAAPALMLAVTSSDPPDRALAVLAALHASRGGRLESSPELMAALCVVWDDPDRFGGEDRPVDAARVVRLFRYYADHSAVTRGAGHALPVDQLIFVVDNALEPAEIEWVHRQHPAGDVGDAFFGVAYGPSRPLTRQPKPGDDPDTFYSLPNLHRFGGRLADQAYYAAQVGKVFGVPTAACAGLQREGQESQAWVAFMVGRGGDARWDASSGRYRLHHGSPGQFIDPQTMELSPLGELALVAGAARTPATKRAGAAALCRLLDHVDAEKRVAALRRAAELSPWDRRIWQAVADAAQQYRPASDEHRELVDLVSLHLRPRAPEAAAHVRLSMLAKVAAEDRAAALAELSAAFTGRVDLAATIQLARVEALLEKKDADAALHVLGDIIDAAEAVPAHAVAAMRHIEDVLRERSELDRLAAVYQQLWSRLRSPPPSPVAHTTPYYAIGQEYAQLLEELGRKHEMNHIRERLGQLRAEPVRR